MSVIRDAGHWLVRWVGGYVASYGAHLLGVSILVIIHKARERLQKSAPAVQYVNVPSINKTDPNKETHT